MTLERHLQPGRDGPQGDKHRLGSQIAPLTSREQELVDACQRGKPLVCSQLTPVELADSEDPAHRISAEVIRDLLLGRHGGLDSRGLLLVSARITGQLNLDNVTTKVDLALVGCYLDAPVRANAAHLRGLSLSSSHLPALTAVGLQVDSGVFLDHGFTAAGAGDYGAVLLAGARITGRLTCRGAELTNTTGPALFADRLQVDGIVFLDEGFNAAGAGELGAVRLLGAHITGQLSCRGAHLTNTAGPALLADGLQVDRNVFLDDGFTAASVEQAMRAMVCLDSAQVGGTLYFGNGGLSNPAGMLVDLDAASVRRLVLPGRAICPAIDDDDPKHQEHREREITVDGLTYTSLNPRGFGGASSEQWLHWLRHHTPSYTAQPYQQFAAVQRAAGDDEVARDILITQQQHLRKSGALGPWPAGLLHGMFGGFVGYGYRTGRALVGLAVVLALSIGLGLLAGNVIHTGGSPDRSVAAHTKETATPGTPCSLAEQVGLGVDRALPLISTGVRAQCDLDTISPVGQVFSAVAWLLQLVAWALATLVIAGYTGLIRKPS